MSVLWLQATKLKLKFANQILTIMYLSLSVSFNMYEYFSNRVQIRHQVFEKNYQLLLLLLFPIAGRKQQFKAAEKKKKGNLAGDWVIVLAAVKWNLQ